MKISESREGAALVMHIEGRLDHAGSEIFDRAISAHIAAGERKIVVDFGGVDFVASMGLRALIKPYQQLAPAGGKLVVTSLGDSVRKVFQIAGMDRAIPIHDSVASAVAAEFSG